MLKTHPNKKHIYIYLPGTCLSSIFVLKHRSKSRPFPFKTAGSFGFQVYIYIIYVPGSKLHILGMVIRPLIGNPYNGYINPYYWVDDHPLSYGNNGSLDPGTYIYIANHLRCFFETQPTKSSLRLHQSDDPRHWCLVQQRRLFCLATWHLRDLLACPRKFVKG